ncbi:hypothetical protein [Kribbella sp. CA-247076]|uniref:hypothetical protein n=1 Tax=Kribbella sp. CA-247076 TaxID=3239941 RepID=UPI003D909A63
MKEPIGSVAEEAAKLFAVLQQAADTRTPPSAGSRSAGTPTAGTPTAGTPVDGPDDVRRDPGDGVRRDAGDGVRRDAGDGVPGHEHGIGRGPECQWCPVCQVINKVRNTSPETIEQLSTAAAHVLGSVRSLLEAAAEAARQAREDAASRPEPPSGEQQEEPVRSRVDRIDVSEDPEPWD